MRTVSLLIASLIVGILLVSLNTATPTKNTKIRIAHGASEGHHLHRALLKFKRDVEAKSNGHFEVIIYPQSQLGPDRELIETTQMGIIQISVPPSSILASWDTAFEVVELPFIYPSKESAYNVINSSVADNLLERLQLINLKGLGFMESGVRHMTNNIRPINNITDFKGIKLRTMKVSSHLETFNSLEAQATPMNFGEVFSALQQRVVDGQENPISLIYAQRFFEVQKYMTLTNHVMTFYTPVMNLDFWESLPLSDQLLIKESFLRASLYQRKLIASETQQQVSEMKKAGLIINELDTITRQAIIAKTHPVREHYREKIGKELFDAWMFKVHNFE
ncbi:TRAP transporter substrate-binding protein [Vibrio breoganii]|uniref:TRAP transporter substrate-binding protein n=1 Tax=Vibrio breoganii TaxID=553239 RepID=UPI000C842B37|nr:TRAP transporter substrate-binding protein [Vibrio breoganii]PMO29945.1 C4-dicarboxylate ABC transporter substrate-binding protein [Vibrio breoganii]